MVVSGYVGAAQLAREHQRRDARDVRLERDHLQVHQQLQVLLERRRHAGRHVGQRQVLAHARLGALNPPLDLAHVVEILRRAAAGRPAADRFCSVATCPITESSRLRDSCRRARRSAPVPPSPNSFSNTSRGLFCIGSGSRRRLPRDRVAVGAAERRLAGEHRFLDRQLERRQRRVLADVLRRDLVDRHAEMRLRAALGNRAGQEHRRRARVVGARRDIGAAGAGDVRMRQAADDVDALAERLERLQDLGEREAGAFRSPASTCPSSRRAARRSGEARLRRSRPCSAAASAPATIESSNGSATMAPDAAQERASREVLLGDEHRTLAV